MREVLVASCGLIPYEDARRAQKLLERARHREQVPDVLLLLEHPPVYTKGRRAQAAELPMGERWYRMQGIEVVDTDRGGRVTYHGPGQLVAYPIVALADIPRRNGAEPGPRGLDIPGYVAGIERSIISALADWGVEAQVIEGLTGVWTAGDPPPGGAARKIGSIGIHVNRGITTHGLAINVNNDLQPFEWVVPCGIEAVRMTSLCQELGGEQDIESFGRSVGERFGERFGRRVVEVTAAELAARVEGIAGLASEAAAPVR